MFNYCPPVELIDLKSETFPDGKRYYTLPDGTRLPSVTTVLGAMKKAEIMAWRKRVGEEAANAISRKASSRGTSIHTICENYLNNDPDYAKKAMPINLVMFDAMKPFLNRINNIHYQECALWSKQLGMAGRCDVIAEFDGELSVIDFKTSKRIKKTEDISDYFWQTTAYSLMYEELIGVPINNLVIIMGVDDEETLLFKEKTKDHIDGLAEAINFYHRSLAK